MKERPPPTKVDFHGAWLKTKATPRNLHQQEEAMHAFVELRTLSSSLVLTFAVFASLPEFTPFFLLCFNVR
jgi:hypothetical protein